MGEARRRKLAGLRRGGPVEAFRVPAGQVAFTFDIEGANPSTAVFPVDKLTDVLAEADGVLAVEDFYGLTRNFIAEFRRAKAAGEAGADFAGLGILGAWLVMNHPTSGHEMARAISAALRRDGKAHVTLCFAGGHLGIALAEAFIDLAKLTASVREPVWSCASGSRRSFSEPRPSASQTAGQS